MPNSSATINMPISSTPTDHGTKKRSQSDPAFFVPHSTSLVKGRFIIPSAAKCMDLEVGNITHEEFDAHKRVMTHPEIGTRTCSVSLQEQQQQEQQQAPTMTNAQSKRTKTDNTGAIIRYDLLNPTIARYLARYWRSFPKLREEKYITRYPAFKAMVARMDENGRLPQSYTPRNHKDGRVFTDGMSLQNSPKLIRNTIMHDSLVDFDFWACHAHLCQQWCRKNGVATPNLGYYLDNREECHAQNVHLDLKKAVNSSLNGGGGDILDEEKPSWLTPLQVEIKDSIMPAVKRLRPDLYQLAVKIKTEERKAHNAAKAKLPKKQQTDFYYNPEGSALSMLLDELEWSCLRALDDYGVTNDLWDDSVALEFDGMKVPFRGDNPASVIEAMQSHIFHKTGYGPIIKIKEPDPEKFLPLPDDLTKPPPATRIFVDDDREAAEIFIDILGDDFGVCDGIYFYRDPGTPLWLIGTDKDKRAILDAALLARCTSTNMWTWKKVGKHVHEVPYSAMRGHARSIIDVSMAIAPQRHNFIEELHQKMKMQLVYRNGYYCFRRQDFVRNFIDVETTIQIPFDFPERNEDDIEELYSRVIRPIFDNRNYWPAWLHIFSRAMAGHSTDKLCSTIIGPRNSGKTLMLELLQAAFGGYITTILADEMQDTQKRGDANLATSFLLSMEWSRLCCASEMTVDRARKDPPKLSGQLIKMAQSGGERQKARCLWANTRPVRVNAHLCIVANALPDFTSSDCHDRMVPLEFPNHFVEPKVKAANSFDPVYKLKDDNVKIWANTDPRAAAAMTHILFKAYKETPFAFSDYPELEARRDTLKGDVEEESIFTDLVELTAQEDDIVPRTDVQKMLKEAGVNMSLEQFRQWLDLQYKAILKTHKVPFPIETRKGNHQRTYYLRGLRLKKSYGDDRSAPAPYKRAWDDSAYD